MNSAMQNKSENGFTLVEILVAVTLMTVALFSIITIFTSVLVDTISDQTKSNALKIAEKDIEYVRGLKYDQIGILGAASPDPVGGILTSSQDVSSADSRFKFVGNKKYKLSREIEWIDDVSSASSDQDYKRFKVTVTWDKPNRGGSVSLTSDFQPTSVTTSLNQAPLIQFLEPQQNNLIACGNETFEVYAVDPEDLDDISVNITITNPAYPGWFEFLNNGVNVSSYDITFAWDSTTVTDDATAYNLLAVAADASSKLNSTSRTIFTDNQPAGWSGGATIDATFNGTSVDVSWNAATNVPAFFQYYLHRTDLTGGGTVTFGPFPSSTGTYTDSSVILGRQYEYVVRTSNACGVTSASSQDAGGTASITVPASVSYNLYTSFTGLGSVDAVFASTSHICNISAGCVYSIPVSTSVSLRPYSASSDGYRFASWDASSPAGCAGTNANPCTFLMSGPTTARAIFSTAPTVTHTLTVRSNTQGSVFVDMPIGSPDWTCPAGSPCTRLGVPDLTALTLTGVPPASGSYDFASWDTGACRGSTSPSCSFTLSASSDNRAFFTVNVAPVWNSAPVYPQTLNAVPEDFKLEVWLRAKDITPGTLKYEVKYCLISGPSCPWIAIPIVFPFYYPFPSDTLNFVEITVLSNAQNKYGVKVRVCDNTSGAYGFPDKCTPASAIISSGTTSVPDPINTKP